MNEAELLFTKILNCNRLSLYLNRDTLLNKNKLTLVSSILKRRILGEPIQYILGKTEFMGLEFEVEPDVFIPRPETEILVETVIKFSSCVVRRASCVNILDIGTGSGCIAISLAKFLPKAKIIAIDISAKVLKVAQYNAQLNKVRERINFIKSDLFTQYAIRNTQYDLIVSNPPYIPTAEIEGLQPEIRYESAIALDGGKDGLDFYRRVIRSSSDYLKEEGFLIIEIGFNQKDAIKKVFQKSGDFEIIEVIKDYNNIDRVIVSKKVNSKH